MRDDIAELIKALSADDAEVRNNAADKILDLGPRAKDAVPALVAVIEHRDTRPLVVAALRAIGPDAKDAIPALVQVMNDTVDESSDRSGSGYAIVSITGRDAIPILKTALIGDDPIARCVAASSLSRMRSASKTVVPILIDALKDENAEVRDSISSALEELGESAVADLKAALQQRNTYVRVYAAYALARIDGDRHGRAVVPAVVGELKNRDPVVRWEAATALELAGRHARPALATLQEALTDSDEHVRASVITALGNIGPIAEVAIPRLIKAMEDPDSWVQFSAMQSLGHLGPAAKAAIPALRESLTSPDALKRRFAAEALGGIGPDAKHALPALQKLVYEDKYEDVQKAAARAVKKIQRG